MEKLTSGLPFENIRVKYSIPKELWEEIIATFHNLIEDLDLENSEKENLLRKFALFIRAGSKYDLEDLTAAVKMFPEVYSQAGKPELAMVLNMYLEDKEKSDRVAWDRIQENEGEVPLIIEKTLLGGDYHLAKLFTRRQISENGAALNTCIQEDSLERYYNKSLDEKVELLSIVTAEYEPVVTIVIDKEKKEILQIRKKNNERVNGTEEFFRAVEEALKHLITEHSYNYAGKAESRKIRRVHDLEEMSPAHPILINANGELVDYDTFDQVPSENILEGSRIKVSPDLSLEKLEKIAQSIAVDLDMTSANEEQKKSLSIVKGSIVDNSEVIFGYDSLERVEGGLYFSEAKKVSIEKIKIINGKLMANSCEELDMPKLEWVGSRVEINSAVNVDLKYLQYVGGILKIDGCKVAALPVLVRTGYSIFANSATEIKMDKYQGTEGVLYAGSAENLFLPSLTVPLKVITTTHPTVTAPGGLVELINRLQSI